MGNIYFGYLVKPIDDPEAIVPVDFRNGTRLQMKFIVTDKEEGKDYETLPEMIEANVSYFLDPDSEWYNANVLKLAKKGWNGSVISGEVEFDEQLHDVGCRLERKEKDGHVNWSFASNFNVISDSKAKSMNDQIAAIIAGQKSAEPAPKAPEPKAPVFAKKGSPRTAPPAPPAKEKKLDAASVWGGWTDMFNGEPSAEEWTATIEEWEKESKREQEDFNQADWKAILDAGKELSQNDDSDPV